MNGCTVTEVLLCVKCSNATGCLNTIFKYTTTLATKGYMICYLKDATEIWTHTNNFNRDTGFRLSQQM
jgi:hypothetical protein